MSILVTLGISVRAAMALFALFTVQFVSSIVLPADVDRVVIVVMSAGYVLLAVVQFVRHRHVLVRTSRDGVVTPLDDLVEADRVAP